MYLGGSTSVKNNISSKYSSDIDEIESIQRKFKKLMYRVCCIANSVTTGGGGTTPIPSIYPFIITSADFNSDGVSYTRPAIAADTLELFVNEYSQQFLVEGPNTFSITSTGIIMNIPGFDANTQDWTIRIDKLN